MVVDSTGLILFDTDDNPVQADDAAVDQTAIEFEDRLIYDERHFAENADYDITLDDDAVDGSLEGSVVVTDGGTVISNTDFTNFEVVRFLVTNGTVNLNLAALSTDGSGVTYDNTDFNGVVSATDDEGEDIDGNVLGADVVTAGAGADILIGAAANETLIGGAGDDQITGGAGVDSLSGGAGNDTFIFADFGDSGQAVVGSDSADVTDVDRVSFNDAGDPDPTVETDLIDVSGLGAAITQTNQAGTLSGDTFTFDPAGLDALVTVTDGTDSMDIVVVDAFADGDLLDDTDFVGTTPPNTVVADGVVTVATLNEGDTVQVDIDPDVAPNTDIVFDVEFIPVTADASDLDGAFPTQITFTAGSDLLETLDVTTVAVDGDTNDETFQLSLTTTRGNTTLTPADPIVLDYTIEGTPAPISIDAGAVGTPAPITGDNAVSESFNDDVEVFTNVEITNFAADDQLFFSGLVGGTPVADTDVVITPAANTEIGVSNGATSSTIILIGVDTSVSMPADVAAFNALGIGEIVIA